MGTGVYWPRGESAGFEADLFLPFSAEVKYVDLYLLSSTRLHGVDQRYLYSCSQNYLSVRVACIQQYKYDVGLLVMLI